jgi:myxalamid-type polyketide synthase MxaB
LGIWDDEQMAAERPDVRYFAFDLDGEERREPGLIQSILAGLVPRFASGELRPLPHRVFPVHQVGEALRYVRQTERVGKVVVAISPDEIEASCSPPTEIQGEATYLITGGLGALGLQVARWLVDQGARHLVLSSRRGPKSSEQSQAIGRLEAAGAEVRVIPADVTSRESVERLVGTVRSTGPPLRGVVHAAGVLDDGMLRMQDWPRFEQVMRPKVAGAWYLHEFTKDLDFFVLFSSGVGLVGAHGQGNYAAGNAFLDALAHYRRAKGQPALSIAWGPWADLGMTAGMDDHARARMAEVGLEPIDLDQGLAMFGRLLRSPLPHAAAMRIDWRRLAATFPPPPLWADLARDTETPREGPSAVLQQLRTVAGADRMDMLIGHLRSTVAGVLGWNSPDQVGPRQKLFDLGMDSLTSVELRTRLEGSLGCSLPLTVAFDYPSVEALADFVAQQLGLLDEEPAPPGVESEEVDEDAERLAAMSDEEVESLLAEKFKDLL